MFSLEWQKYTEKGEKNKTDYSEILRIAPTIWEEHCLECSPPECYNSCLVYKAREDGACERIKDGLLKSYKYDGFYGYSVKAHFNRWAKLEILYRSNAIAIKDNEKINNIIQLLNFCFKKSACFLWVCKNKWFLLRKWELFRQKVIQWLVRKSEYQIDNLLIDVTNESDTVDFILEIKTVNNLLYREKLSFQEGRNKFIKFIDTKYYDSIPERKYIYLYPLDTSREVELYLHTLELIQSRIKEKPTQKKEMIKCVVWDLDNTIWEGILSEDKDNLKLNTHVINVIKKLEEKGIVSSIASKNDSESVMAFLEELNIKDYFLVPQISWGPKSESIKKIATRLNIGLDSIAFFDDSVYERNEVSANSPLVHCFDIRDLDNVLKEEAFNPPVSHESKLRKDKYIQNLMRDLCIEQLEGNIIKFIKESELKLDIREGKLDNIDRYYELIQRTNQLNISVNRLSINEIEKIILDNNKIFYELSLTDKYGEYGIIGISIMEIVQKKVCISDMLFSCRAARKYVEETFLYWIIAKFSDCSEINVKYKKTEKNTQLIQKFIDVGFHEHGDGLLYFCIDQESVNYENNIGIEVRYCQ